MNTILYIDDDPDDIIIFQEVISAISHAYTLKSFTDPIQGLLALQHGEVKPGLAFLDVNMPKIGGKEVLRRIRAIHTLDHIPVIMYSTGMCEADKEIYLSLGANGCLKKADFIEDTTTGVVNILKTFFGTTVASV